MCAKLIKFTPIVERGNVFEDKISLKRLGEIWNDENTNYSEDELSLIRDWLYAITEIIFETSKATEQKIIELKPHNYEETQGDIVCEGEYRRAS